MPSMQSCPLESGQPPRKAGTCHRLSRTWYIADISACKYKYTFRQDSRRFCSPAVRNREDTCVCILRSSMRITPANEVCCLVVIPAFA